jgi:hypothetical protein
LIEDRIFSVYIHKFPNGKQYVGITSIEPKERWHSGYGYRNNKIMFEDIKKYGWKNIEHTLFNDEGILYDEEEACYIEKCLIDSWDLLNPEKGYNLMSGGTISFTQHKNTRKKIAMANSIPVIQYSTDGNKIAEFSSLKKASKQTNIVRSNISLCCLNKHNTAGGYVWRYKTDNLESIEPQQPKEKAVIQYSTDGNKIAEFSSIAKVEKMLNIKGGNISKCCRGEFNTAGGYVWRYKTDNLESIEPQQPKEKAVIQYSTDGNKIAEFSSIKKASKQTNIVSNNICNCCRGKLKTAGGYIWRYKNKVDNLKNEI